VERAWGSYPIWKSQSTSISSNFQNFFPRQSGWSQKKTPVAGY
jgi:hypothetical protein